MTNSIDLEGNWMEHPVIHFNGEKGIRYLNARLKIPSGPWNKIVYGPCLAYIPEKDRLLMTVYSEGREDGLINSLITKSDDRGDTWSEPEYIHKDKSGVPDCGGGIVLSYLGNGKMILFTEDCRCWYSNDYGETWDGEEAKKWVPGQYGNQFYTWCQTLLDKDTATGEAKRMIVGGYISFQGVCRGGVSISYDEGKTWDTMEVPQWIGFNEAAIVRAGNGDLIAALRTQGPWRFRNYFDHFSGLGISISTDNGYTWSEVKMLYEWGRHHPSMVLLPDGRLILTYVVRLGYPCTDEGIPQWGIEAVESRDNGRTWDLDHRYILAKWQGSWRGPNSWIAGSQQTSTLLMPDGTIYTAFGTGEGAETRRAPLWRSAMNIGLVADLAASPGEELEFKGLTEDFGPLFRYLAPILVGRTTFPRGYGHLYIAVRKGVRGRMAQSGKCGACAHDTGCAALQKGPAGRIRIKWHVLPPNHYGSQLRSRPYPYREANFLSTELA